LGDLTLALLSPLSLPTKNKKVIETNMHCVTPRSSAVLIRQVLNGLSLEHKNVYCFVAVVVDNMYSTYFLRGRKRI